ncbi:globin [Granulicoccus phenolivorans]|uniref:globin n=1 Tax=Granulicoccus phenolivorans TaxID=266854 RepID=UPI001FE06436|nr:globin [Granulicoccus phenolivorans]
MNRPIPPETFYDAVGGHAFFAQLTHEFYRRVAADADFRAMYPEEDLGPAEDRLRMFLEQYWGGPSTYQEQRGHPRLRMRHMPFRITTVQRDIWLGHMRAALATTAISPELEEILLDYLTRAADAMRNTPDDAPAEPRKGLQL